MLSGDIRIDARYPQQVDISMIGKRSAQFAAPRISGTIDLSVTKLAAVGVIMILR
jgi:hypothetical protein